MNLRRAAVPYLFVGAAALYLVTFTAVPLFRGAWLSLTETKLLNPFGGEFIGLDNYRQILAEHQFYASLLTTITYTALTVALSLALGTVAALAVNARFRGRALVRSLLTMPWAVPSISVVLVFTWMYNVDSGVANRAIGLLGIGQQGWLIDPDLGLIAVVAASVWKVFPFVMLVVLAALQGVPAELAEAARVDGADRLTVFTQTALPHLMPTLRVVALLMTIWSLRRFEIIYLLTGGGPADSTTTLVIDVYREAFHNSDLGRAATLGMLGLVLSLVVTVVYFVLDRRATKAAGL